MRVQREMGLMSGAVPFMAMITAEFTDVGVSTLSKAAMTKGMSNFVFVGYYNALGTIILLPFVACRLLSFLIPGSNLSFTFKRSNYW